MSKAPREKTAERGYGSRWRKARASFLGMPSNETCRMCKANGLLDPGTMRIDGSLEFNSRRIGLVVDHINPHRGSQQLFWDRANWQPLSATNTMTL